MASKTMADIIKAYQRIVSGGRKGGLTGGLSTSEAKKQAARINGRKHLPAGDHVVTSADDAAHMAAATMRACRARKGKA